MALAGLAMAGCDRPVASTGGAKGGPPVAKGKGGAPAVVTVSRPLVEELVEWDEFVGRFEAVDAVELRARVSGYLMEVAFQDGQTVAKGMPLFVIDPRPFERAVALARAELEQARTKAQNTRLDVERGRPLLERKVMSEKQFDDRSNLLREAEAAIKVSEARLATAELELSFTRIAAPIGGRISRTNVSAGNWIAAGGTASSTLLTTIVSQDPVHVYFDVSENNYLKYMRLTEKGQKAGVTEVGAPVELALPDETGFKHKGVVDFIDNRLDQGTATMRARAVVENKSGMLSPGMFARVRVAGSARYAASLLPETAIATDQASKYVLVVGDDGTVGRRTVILGPRQGALRIVREGITASDWVITNGLQRARPGQKVDAKREPIKLSASPAAGTPGPGAPPAAPPPPSKN